MAVTFSATARYKAGEHVALFLPCYCDVLFPYVGQAMVALFSRLGIALEYPMEQTCCGQPAFNAGQWDEARTLGARFSRVFGEYQWIVVPSGSCGAMARGFYKYMDPESPAAAVGTRVYDLATFVFEILGRTDVGARFDGRVTYLEGCHGKRELGASAAAKTLLKAVRGLDYVELPNIDECCGFGGTFAVKYPELSVSMGQAKCTSIAQTGASVVSSQDSSCLMHIEGLIRKSQPSTSLQFLHLAQILAAT
ncbi:MAG TPA: (Fe-S)-binding protein [Candidatus Eremiobacteraceae bacterium]|nr:(Fe-S)-binding protein [Candidatus Eremiobacteraceae bacterium]